VVIGTVINSNTNFTTTVFELIIIVFIIARFSATPFTMPALAGETDDISVRTDGFKNEIRMWDLQHKKNEYQIVVLFSESRLSWGRIRKAKK
jgi:hypothetical protein